METTAEVKNPFQSAPNSKKMLMVVALFLAVFGSIFHTGVLSTMLPVAAAEIGGLEYYSLASSLSGVLGVASMPLWGYLGARNPALKRTLFVVSMFIGAIVVCTRAFATSMMFIIVGNIFYGFVSAGIFVIGYGLIRDMFDAAKAGTYLGLVGTVQGIALIAGPIAGGMVMDAFGWRIVCHCIWPFLALSGILVLVGGVKVTKEEAAALSRPGRIDASGITAMCILLAALMLFLSLGKNFIPFGSPGSWGLLALALIGLIWLIMVMKKKQGEAVIPLPALKDRNTVSLALANFFSMFANMAVFFFIPMYLLQVLGASATGAGIATSIPAIGNLILCPIWGKMIGKAQNARFVISFGLVFRIGVCVGCLIGAMLNLPIVYFYALMVVAGVYGSSQSTGFSVGPQVQIPESMRMQGNSVVQVGQNFGSSCGTAVYTVIIATFGIAQGMTYAFGLAAIMSVLGLIFALRLKALKDM